MTLHDAIVVSGEKLMAECHNGDERHVIVRLEYKYKWHNIPIYQWFKK